MFKPESGRRYDMPVVFGPSRIGGQASYGEIRSIAHSFLTEASALEPLIPYHFKLARPARVTVVGRMHRDVTGSTRPALSKCPGLCRRRGPRRRSCDQRSLRTRCMGVGRTRRDRWPRVPGHLQDRRRDSGARERSDRAAFECYEYGTRLLRVEVSEITPAGDDAVAGSQSGRRGDHPWLEVHPRTRRNGRRRLPSQGCVSRPNATAAWTGVKPIAFDQPTWGPCPISSRIIETLAALPVVEVLPATMTLSKGAAPLDRAASARLG